MLFFSVSKFYSPKPKKKRHPNTSVIFTLRSTGLTDYAVVPPVIGLVSRFIGANAVGLAMGILLAFHSIGAAIGAAIGSHAFDNDGHYDVVLAVCCGLCFCASILCALIPEKFNRSKGKNENGEDDMKMKSDTNDNNNEYVRCVFDVGSGATKAHVAIIDRNDNQVKKSLYSHQTQVLLRHDIQSSDDGTTFSKKILTECRECLLKYKKIANEFGCTRFNGIATAVFRYAKNGEAFLKLLNEEDGLSIEVISQKEEGKVGYLSAVCVAPKTIVQENIIAWDSGGGSFQITDSKYNVFEGPYGSTHALTRALEKKDMSFDPKGSASPFTKEEFDTLIQQIKLDLESNVVNNSDEPMSKECQIVFNKLQAASDNVQVVCIGGDTCVFRMAAYLMESNGSGKIVETTMEKFSRDELYEKIIEMLLNKTDVELEEMGYPQANMLIPKLCLMISVMDCLNIENVIYRVTNGSTEGLLIC